MSRHELRTPARGKIAGDYLESWAADNEAYTGGFNAGRFFGWLAKMEPWRERCLFVAVPDSVGNAIETLGLYREWVWHFDGWPVAFVAQDGQESLRLPDHYDALFVGGTTDWKMSDAAESVIRRAQREGKHIHIGRVNWWKRYAHFRLMEGSDGWTCDGTRPRFDGRDNTMEAWGGYMAQRPLLRL